MTENAQDLADIVSELDEDVRAMLREDLPSQRDAVIAAMDAGDWQSARDVVHTVNGSASFCRLHELQSAAAALEHELDAQMASDTARHAFLNAIEQTLLALG